MTGMSFGVCTSRCPMHSTMQWLSLVVYMQCHLWIMEFTTVNCSYVKTCIWPILFGLYSLTWNMTQCVFINCITIVRNSSHCIQVMTIRQWIHVSHLNLCEYNSLQQKSLPRQQNKNLKKEEKNAMTLLQHNHPFVTHFNIESDFNKRQAPN